MLEHHKELIRKILQSLRNRYDLYLLTKFCHGFLIAAESLVRRQLMRHFSEGGLVLLKDLLGQLAVFNLFPHHRILGDKPLIRLPQQDLMTELYRFVAPPTLDQFCVVFEEAEDPIIRGNDLSSNPGPLCNAKNRFYTAQVAFHLEGKVVKHSVRSPLYRTNVFGCNLRYPLDLLDQLDLAFLHFALTLLVAAPGIPGNEKIKLFNLL